MSGSVKKRKKKHHFLRNFLLLAIVVAAGVGAWVVYQDQQETETVDTTSYRQETVKYGSVITGVTESGTVTYGTADQTFEVAEVTSSSSSGSSGSSGMSSMSMSSDSSSSGSSSTALEVEEIYVAVGQVVSEGDALLKITEGCRYFSLVFETAT
ncbi:MAG: hypothetical protein LIP11_07760 [Clostridiales bacterium]|nr:hypothetical protein [Clostridiales bacterium]